MRVRQDKRVKAATGTVPVDGWTPIQYTHAVFDEQGGRWISWAGVAEIDSTAARLAPTPSRHCGRVVILQIPDVAPKDGLAEPSLFDTWRCHAFFTTRKPHPSTLARSWPTRFTDMAAARHLT